jgi:hypothetical protein
MELRTVGHAAIIAVTLVVLTIGLSSSLWADWCNGACY